MSRWLILLTDESARPSDVDTWLATANRLATSESDVVSSSAARVLPGKLGAADIVWTLILDGRVDGGTPPAVERLSRSSSPVRVREVLPVQPLAAHVFARTGRCALRTLLIRVAPGTPASAVHGLETALIAMPKHIPSIRSWSLSRLDPARTAEQWTLLWEQEFDEPGGFRPYMAHPYHWTGVERWFDPEIPGFVVEAEEHYITEVLDPVIGMG